MTRRVLVRASSLCIALCLLAGCTNGQPSPVVPPGTVGGTYTDPAGWSIEVEPGWRVQPFHAASQEATGNGILISNEESAVPSVEAGYMPQTNERTLPRTGIGLVIGTDDDPAAAAQAPIAKLPLHYPEGWGVGDAPPGFPTVDAVRVSVGGQEVFVTLTTGDRAIDQDRSAITRMIGSIRSSGPE